MDTTYEFKISKTIAVMMFCAKVTVILSLTQVTTFFMEKLRTHASSALNKPQIITVGQSSVIV